MQTEITTEYIRKLQQSFRERAWAGVLNCVEAINPSLPRIHQALLEEIRKHPTATQYTIHVGSICVDSLPHGDIHADELKEKFLDCYSVWMDRYVPSAHVEVKLGYPCLEFYFVFSLL